MQELKNYIDQNKQRFLDELLEMLKIPSISADPAYKSDVSNQGTSNSVWGAHD